jgi:opacity protein-like surface antigen
MKTVMVAALAGAVLICSGGAQAADMSARYAPPMAPYAPGPNWSGLYVGGHLGGVFNNESVNDSFGSGSTDPSGFLGGIQLGGVAPSFVELGEAGAAVNDVKRPSPFGQQRGCLFPFRSERQARLARPEAA